jgi:ATP-independent RNA helicase DbpA
VSSHDSATDFGSLPLAAALVANVAKLGYASMTPIQAAALPPILAGRDVIAQAKTGSGKTAAFGLGLLQRLEPSAGGGRHPQALVLCPTRELADQVSKDIRSLARAIPNVKVVTLCGGIPIRTHRDTLEHGADVVVGTPGRLRALIEKQSLVIAALSVVVLDEADRMLDMGFEEDLRAILQAAPSERQTLLFSATYPEAIQQLSAGYQRAAVRLSVDLEMAEGQLEQSFFEVHGKDPLPTPQEKNVALLKLLAHYQPPAALVFCNTRDDCHVVARELRREGLRALALNGDLEQRERDEVLVVFANGSCSVLVATDVAARGLDIPDLDCVINYELSPDPAVHLHRIGRTGRAGKQGLALSLFDATQRTRLERIEDRAGGPGSLTRIKLNTLEARGIVQRPAVVTLCIEGGRRDKLRPGDILGALTGEGGIEGDAVGKIDVQDARSYVAVKREVEKKALDRLTDGRIKKKRFRVSKVAAG